MLYPADDADNRVPPILLGFDHVDSLANRVLIGPELLGHVFVDDRDRIFPIGVVLIEEAASQ